MKNQYKVLLVKFLVFVVLLVSCDFIIGYIMRKLENIALENSGQSYVWHYGMRKANEDLIIIGASEASHSFVPEILMDSLEMSMFNSGADGAGFYYQNATINNFIDRNKPKIIIWTLSPVFLSLPYSKQISQMSDLNPFYEEDEYCNEYIQMQSKYEKYKMASWTYRYNSKLILTLMYVRHHDNSPIRYVPLYGTSLGLEKLQNDFVDKPIDEKVVSLFGKTIEKCKKNNIRLVLAIPPYYVSSNYKSSTQFQKLESIVEEYDIEMIDLFTDSMFCDRKELFYDNAHLNDDGARIYSAIIAGYLKHNQPD